MQAIHDHIIAENDRSTRASDLIVKVINWADKRALLKPENTKAQMLKVMEELGETASALNKGKQAEIIDGIGDTLVTLIILSAQLGYDPTACLQIAYDEIANRKGKMVNGVFIKE